VHLIEGGQVVEGAKAVFNEARRPWKKSIKREAVTKRIKSAEERNPKRRISRLPVSG
jgi:uncharacterized Fe-S cluster protein YjdI